MHAWRRLVNSRGGCFGLNYHWLEGQLALEKATCANVISDFRTTAENVQLSRQIAATFHYPELNLRIMGIDSGMKRQQANYDAAWREALDGLHLYWRGSYSLERLYQFYIVMSKCAAEKNNIHGSEALLRQSINIFEQSAPDDNVLKAMLYLRLANLLLGQGKESMADSEADKAKLLLKDIPPSDATAQKYSVPGRIELAKFELMRNHPAAALSTIQPVHQVLNTQDNFISLNFYSVLGDIKFALKQLAEAGEAYRTGIGLAERAVGGLEDDATRLPLMRATDDMYRGLVRVLVAQKDDVKALALWEWSKTRGLGRRAGELTDPPLLPEVREKHVIYASFRDQLQIWIVQGHDIQSHSVQVKQADLLRMVGQFAQSCANVNSKPDLLEKQASELYALLLQPVLTDITSLNPVVIELDESMSMLKMEALRTSSGGYFGESHSVVYSPGILAENTLRSVQPLHSAGTMLLVDAAQSEGGTVLPGHVEELNAVRRTFLNTVVLGPGTKVEQITKALTRSTEFHFSGHGRTDGTGTALLIGPDLSLRARDFSSDRLKHLQLAVLSACSSASAQKGAFDESNLVRSFLSGGVPNVIASGWDVDSKSTAHFMSSFYKHLANGEIAAEALQHAQAEVRSINEHPYYWAAFTLAGRAN